MNNACEATVISEEDAALESQRGQVLQEFEVALREQPDLDQEGRDFLTEHFRQAVESTPLQPVLTGMDRAAWMETFNVLVGQAIDGPDRDALVRQLNEAADSLQTPDAQAAMEFAERVQREGEAAALDWLRKQQQEASTKRESQKISTLDAPIGRQSITRSRSRRLRGPPE